MKKLLIGILTVLTIACGEKSSSKFSLSGKTIDFEDGTFLYLDYNNEVIDSAIVENNSFEFSTELPSSPINLWMHNKDFSKYRSFWAENRLMKFDATESDFRKAIITGSETENTSFDFFQSIDTLPRFERQKMEMDFVRKNPNSIISAFLLSLYSTTWGKDKTMDLYKNFSSSNKDSEFGKKINRFLELSQEPEIGQQYVDFESENPQGEARKLSNLAGKVTLLEFWASWCAPCRHENPNLVKTYAKFNPKGFEIFAVSMDHDKNSWLTAIEEDELNWEHVSDLKGNDNEASIIYGVSGIPDNFLIAENGEIIGRNLRGEKLNEKLSEFLE